MMKKLILGASLLTCLVAVAADVQPANVAQAQSHDKKSLALQCQQEATEKKLEGIAKKRYMVKCINPDAVKPVLVK